MRTKEKWVVYGTFNIYMRRPLLLPLCAFSTTENHLLKQLKFIFLFVFCSFFLVIACHISSSQRREMILLETLLVEALKHIAR